MVLGSIIEQSSAQVLEGKSREYSKQKDIRVPNEILINKKLNNPAIFQKWEEFFFKSGLWSYFRWFNSSTKYVYGHVHSSLRILVNISGPIKRHGVVDFVTLWNYLNPWWLG